MMKGCVNAHYIIIHNFKTNWKIEDFRSTSFFVIEIVYPISLWLLYICVDITYGFELQHLNISIVLTLTQGSRVVNRYLTSNKKYFKIKTKHTFYFEIVYIFNSY